MHKRDFLKASGALVAGTVLGAVSTDRSRTNWAGNFRYSTDVLEKPATVEELCTVVKKSAKIRPLGTRHAFNSLADSTAAQVSVERFTDITLDRGAHTVTVGAGIPYGKIAPYLEDNGFALHNLASLPHISVAGATATGTHGSGSRNGNLSTAVRGIELVTADGSVVHLSKDKDGDRFRGAVVNLGSLGVITKLTLAVEPAYDVSQVVYENLPFDVLQKNLDEVFSSGYSVSLFTDWQNHRATQVWIKSRVPVAPAKPEFFGAKLAKRKLHPLAGHSAENCTEQQGIAGPWYERLPHFRMNFTPSSGDELQSEFFVPREHAYEAILAVEKLKDHITPHLMITELRTIDADDLWMSMASGRPSLAIHFTWKPEWPEVKIVLPLIERQLAPFAPRPHWAKLFTMDPAVLDGRYPRLADFRALANHYDPDGKFRNDFIRRNIFGQA